ncbi:SGNH/GDSL hydrolase family protein [Sphingobium aromaticiconvertens]|uniref:SGNH/GDSL hydrolase family protein n=1 Tax=Sphingobium aromaticiconvertens TaxID=365341 RepID=UPI003017837E
MIKRLLCLLAATMMAAPVSAQHWSRSWAIAPVQSGRVSSSPDLRDKTIRQVVRLSNGGKQLRIRLSNEMSSASLRVGAVRVALADANGKIVQGSSRVVTFDGDGTLTVPPGAPMVSDPVPMAVKPLTRITVSIHLPEGAAAPTIHGYAGATGWIAGGDQTNAVTLANQVTTMQRIILSGVDVETARSARTIVALGDSITDGVRATNDSDRRWPDLLAERLQAGNMRDVGVANLGISGNRLLNDSGGGGINVLARFDRDVLTVPGVSHVILLEGVNDLGTAAREGAIMPSADDIIDSYRQMITRAHDRGVKVILATILPYKGASYWSEAGDTVRQQVNAWIRDNDVADGAVDFDRAIADPADPLRMAKPYDIGDALHPNDAGFRVMADAVPLKLLR